MKKLLVIALSAMMILSMAAVSMAATVTVGGELGIGMDMRSATDTNKTTMSDFNETKLTATAAINDQITAFGAFKATTHTGSNEDVNPNTIKQDYTVMNDEAWVSFKEGFGTVKVGHFGWNPKEYLDIINVIPDLNSPAGINFVTKVTPNVTVDLYASEAADKLADNTDMGALYGAKVNYGTDKWGVGLVTAKYSTVDGEDAVMQLNANYKMDAFNFFLNYSPERDTATGKAEAAIVGCTYDSKTIYARAEYNAQVEDGLDSDYGFRLGYKLNDNAKIEYQMTKGQTKDSDPTSYVKVDVTF